MRYRRLGQTALEISEIGFGAWGIGGASAGAVSYGPTDDGESLRALRRAFDLGVTFYDTADLYGHGHSEQLIGAAFRDIRTRVVLATKVGFLAPYGPQDFSPRHVRTALEGSLRRLQTDYVDVYQLHNPPMDLLRSNPGLVETLKDLEHQGKVRAIGVSVRSPDDGLVAVREFGVVEVVQVNFSMVDQRARENGLLALCERRSVGVICRTPLCFGFLTGKYGDGWRFDPSDHRSAWSAEQIGRWAEAHELFAAELDGTRQTHAQLALRFCLSYAAVSSVIPGMLTVEQVEENTATSEYGRLDEQERGRVEDVYRRNTFFVGSR